MQIQVLALAFKFLFGISDCLSLLSTILQSKVKWSYHEFLVSSLSQDCQTQTHTLLIKGRVFVFVLEDH